MEALKKLWSLVDGKKTQIGFIGYMLVRWLGPDPPAPDWIPASVMPGIDQIFILVFGVGVIDKARKVTEAMKS